MLGLVCKLRGIPAGNPDSVADPEATDRVPQELRSALGPIQQSELDVRLIEGHDEPRHSPAASQIAPALARFRTGGAAMGPRVLDMRLQIDRAEITESLTARELIQEEFGGRTHGENHRSPDVSRETLAVGTPSRIQRRRTLRGEAVARAARERETEWAGSSP